MSKAFSRRVRVRVSRLDSGLCESLSRAERVSSRLSISRAPVAVAGAASRSISKLSQYLGGCKTKMQEARCKNWVQSQTAQALHAFVRWSMEHAFIQQQADPEPLSHIDNVVRALLPCVWSSPELSTPRIHGWMASGPAPPHTPRPRSHRCHAMPSCPRSTRM